MCIIGMFQFVLFFLIVDIALTDGRPCICDNISAIATDINSKIVDIEFITNIHTRVYLMSIKKFILAFRLCHFPSNERLDGRQN